MKITDPNENTNAAWIVTPERRATRRLQGRDAPPAVWLSFVAGIVFFGVKDDVYEWIGLLDALAAATDVIDRSIGTWAVLPFGVPAGLAIHAFVPAFVSFGPLALWLRTLQKREREHRCARCGYPIHIETYPPRDACADTTCTECGLRLLIVPAKRKAQ